MSKIQVTLDANKLRNLVSKRSYENKNGEKVELQEVKFELIEVKQPKQIYEKDNMIIMKTHFACIIQTKEQRETKAETLYIGEGFTTMWGSDKKEEVHKATPINEEPDNDLPF